MMITMAGFGFLIMNGHQPGLIGDMMMIISVGLLYHLMRSLIYLLAYYYNYDYYVSYNHWNYVKYNHFCDQNVYNYYVAPKYKYRVHNRTKMRTNYSYYDGRVRNDGVDFDRIRERSGRNIERRNIVSVNDPNDLSREKIRKTRDKEIRTYFANPDDISRDGLRDVKS
jgi:hypothetical protein